MHKEKKKNYRGNRLTDESQEFYCDIDAQFPAGTDISEIFIRLTRELQQFYPIKRGLLVTREHGGTRFVATASFSEKKTRRNLSLRLPSTSSLFEKVAEGGTVYTEDCPELLSGNSFERNLLLDADTQAVALQPLKHEGQVVGILGYSSDQPFAFAIFEEGLLDTIAEQFAARIAAAPSTQTK